MVARIDVEIARIGDLLLGAAEEESAFLLLEQESSVDLQLTQLCHDDTTEPVADEIFAESSRGTGFDSTDAEVIWDSTSASTLPKQKGHPDFG